MRSIDDVLQRFSTQIEGRDPWDETQTAGEFLTELRGVFPDLEPNADFLEAYRLPDRVSVVPRLLSREAGRKLKEGLEARSRLMRLIHEDIFGPQKLFASFPGFRRMLESSVFYRPSENVFLDGKPQFMAFAGSDIIFTGPDEFVVNEDNITSYTGGPSDIFHLREAHFASNRDLLNRHGVKRLDHYPAQLERQALSEMRRFGIDGRIVIVRSNLNYEQIAANQDQFFLKEVSAFARLADGTSMVHAFTQDLEVASNGDVQLRATGEKVGYIHFNGHRAWIEAIPGLMQAIRESRVVFNAPIGTEYFNDKMMIAWLDRIGETLLGADRGVSEIPTFPFSPEFDGEIDETVFEAWKHHRNAFVLKERNSMGGAGVWVGKHTSPETHEQSLEWVRQKPAQYLIQAYVPISRFHGKLVDLRMVTHIASTQADTFVLEGGFSRSSDGAGGKTNISLGGSEHDTWIRF